MKEGEIYFISDLHADFYMSTKTELKIKKAIPQYVKGLLGEFTINKDTDTLIIAGDVANNNQVSVPVLLELSTYFKNTLFVYGNHDLYLTSNRQKKKYKNSWERLEECYEATKSHVHWLGKEFDGSIYINDLLIAGEAMINNPYLTERGTLFYNQFSNDERCIKGDRVTKYKKELQYYTELRHLKPDIFVSHWPTYVTPKYQGSKTGEEGMYINEQDPVAHLQIHGHTHEDLHLIRGENRYLSHAVGYDDPTKTIQRIQPLWLH